MNILGSDESISKKKRVSPKVRAKGSPPFFNVVIPNFSLNQSIGSVWAYLLCEPSQGSP